MSDKQLKLNLEIKHDASLSDFSGPGWAAIVDAVRQLHIGLINQLYIFGDADTGKSHLLSAICESFIDMGKSAISLSLSDLIYTDVQVLASLETFDVIAIDDLDVVATSPQWQEALFHLINRSKEGQRQLVFAAQNATQDLPFSLIDLVTRLSQAPAFKVPDGSDILDRQGMLASILRRRGWQLDDRIVEYLLAEGPQRIGSIMKVLSVVQPMFVNMPRANISKATINEAIKMIDEQTLLVELQDINELTQAESFDDQNISFNF